MKNSSRFYFVTFPVLMAVIALITIAALWIRTPDTPASPHRMAKTSSSAGADSEEKIIFAPGSGTLSGILLTPDGQPNSTPVNLQYRVERLNQNKQKNLAMGLLISNVTDSFSCKVPAGMATIFAEAEGQAISAIGPLENYAGKTIDDIEFRLEAGKPLTIHLQDPKGNPIADANLSGSSKIGQIFWGAQKAEYRDDNSYEFPRVAASPYRVLSEAPGFESTEFEIEAPHDGPVTLIMERALPTTGIVLDTSGQPVPEAKLILLLQHPNFFFAGKEIGEANERGEFRLLNLSREHRYSGIVQAPDGRCGTFANLKPGQTDLTFHLEHSYRLTGTVHGNLKTLNQRNGKPSVRIHQHIPFPGLGNGNPSLPSDRYAAVETDDGKQTFALNGLLANDWELIAGDVRYQHDGSEGDVHLDINLETGEVTVNPDSTTDTPQTTIP